MTSPPFFFYTAERVREREARARARELPMEHIFPLLDDEPEHRSCSSTQLWNGEKCVNPCGANQTFQDEQCWITDAFKKELLTQVVTPVFAGQCAPLTYYEPSLRRCVPIPTCHAVDIGECRMCPTRPYLTDTSQECPGVDGGTGTWQKCPCNETLPLCYTEDQGWGFIDADGYCVMPCPAVGLTFDVETRKCVAEDCTSGDCATCFTLMEDKQGDGGQGGDAGLDAAETPETPETPEMPETAQSTETPETARAAATAETPEMPETAQTAQTAETAETAAAAAYYCEQGRSGSGEAIGTFPHRTIESCARECGLKQDCSTFDLKSVDCDGADCCRLYEKGTAMQNDSERQYCYISDDVNGTAHCNIWTSPQGDVACWTCPMRPETMPGEPCRDHGGAWTKCDGCAFGDGAGGDGGDGGDGGGGDGGDGGDGASGDGAGGDGGVLTTGQCVGRQMARNTEGGQEVPGYCGQEVSCYYGRDGGTEACCAKFYSGETGMQCIAQESQCGEGTIDCLD